MNKQKQKNKIKSTRSTDAEIHIHTHGNPINTKYKTVKYKQKICKVRKKTNSKDTIEFVLYYSLLVEIQFPLKFGL